MKLLNSETDFGCAGVNGLKDEGIKRVLGDPLSQLHAKPNPSLNCYILISHKTNHKHFVATEEFLEKLSEC